MSTEQALCDCDTCLESDTPCSQDCDSDNLCEGCFENKEAEKDRTFDEACALGYR